MADSKPAYSTKPVAATLKVVEPIVAETKTIGPNEEAETEAKIVQRAPAAMSAPEEIDPRKATKRVIVNRLNVADGNQDLEIVVNDLGVRNGRKAFFPGQEVELTLVQISILKDAVERNHIDIPAGSGIYSSDNPKSAAQQMYPGFTIKQNPHTGMLYAEKHRPNYSISESSRTL